MGKVAYQVGLSFFLIALYLILARVSHFVSPHMLINGVSLLWLPAFVRLFGSLVMGFWFIPVLFVMSFISYFEDNSLKTALFLSLLVSIVVPTTVQMTRRAIGVKEDLSNLTGRHLFTISVTCAAASTFAYNAAHMASSSEWQFYKALMSAFVGNFLGQWFIIYVIKAYFYAQGLVRSRL